MRAYQVAQRVLDLYWDRKLPVDVDAIAKEMLVKVIYQPVLDGGEDISGRFDVLNDQPICTIRNTDSSQRQRFTLAHELGHFALNHGGGFRDNMASFNLNVPDPREVQANAFAAELLMPKLAVDFLIEKKNISDVDELAQIFQVSVPAMTFRMRNLGWL